MSRAVRLALVSLLWAPARTWAAEGSPGRFPSSMAEAASLQEDPARQIVLLTEAIESWQPVNGKVNLANALCRRADARARLGAFGAAFQDFDLAEAQAWTYGCLATKAKWGRNVAALYERARRLVEACKAGDLARCRLLKAQWWSSPLATAQVPPWKPHACEVPPCSPPAVAVADLRKVVQELDAEAYAAIQGLEKP